MDIQETLRLYIQIEADIAEMHQKLWDLTAQRDLVADTLSGKNLPEDFIFPDDGRFYRFLMDVEDGGIRNFAEVENLNVWLAQQTAIDREVE